MFLSSRHSLGAPTGSTTAGIPTTAENPLLREEPPMEIALQRGCREDGFIKLIIYQILRDCSAYIYYLKQITSVLPIYR